MKFACTLIGSLPIFVFGISFDNLIERLKTIDSQAEGDITSVSEESNAFQGWCNEHFLQPPNITEERSKVQDLAHEASALGAEKEKCGAQVEGLERQAESSRQSWEETITSRTKEHGSYLRATKASKDNLEIFQQVLEVLSQEQSLGAGKVEMSEAQKTNLLSLKARVNSAAGGADYKVIIGTIKGMIDGERKSQKDRDRTERMQNENVGQVIATMQKTIDEFETEADVHRERMQLAQSEKAIYSHKYAAGSAVLGNTLKGNDQLHDVCLAADSAGKLRIKDLEKFRSQVALALKYAKEAQEYLGDGGTAKPAMLLNSTHPLSFLEVSAHNKFLRLSKDPTTDRLMRALDTADIIAGTFDDATQKESKPVAAHNGEVEAAKWTLMVAAQKTGRSSLENAANELATHTLDQDVKMLLHLKQTMAEEDPDAAAEEDKAYGEVDECPSAQVEASKKAISAASDVHKLADEVAEVNSTVVGKAAEIEILEAGLERSKNLADGLKEESDALEEAFKAQRENAKTASLEAEKDFGDVKDALRAMDDNEARYTVHTNDPGKVSSTRAGTDSVDARNLIRYIQNVEKNLEVLSERANADKHLEGMLQNAVLGGSGRIKEQEKALKEVRATKIKAEEALDGKMSDLTAARQVADDEKLALVNEQKRCKKLMEQGLPAAGSKKKVGTAVAESAVDTAVNLLRVT